MTIEKAETTVRLIVEETALKIQEIAIYSTDPASYKRQVRVAAQFATVQILQLLGYYGDVQRAKSMEMQTQVWPTLK